MRHFYNLLYDQYPKKVTPETPPPKKPLYKFRLHQFFDASGGFDKDDVPLVFKRSPDSLLLLASIVVDAIPLPTVFTWTNVEVCRWIRQYGYPQYQNTFRVNYIDGHKLLLLDVNALCKMNIKNFDHLQHIAYGIRSLYYFEMTKFMHSISLPPEYWYEYYKLFRTQTGPKYEDTRPTDFWRRMQLLRPKFEYLDHWHLLERWLKLEPPKYQELFGGFRRHCQYRQKPAPALAKVHSPEHQAFKMCGCMWPCDCHWKEEATVVAPPLSIVHEREQVIRLNVPPCKQCGPICFCGWSSKKYELPKVLSILEKEFPYKYGYRPHKGTTDKRCMLGTSLSTLTLNKSNTTLTLNKSNTKNVIEGDSSVSEGTEEDMAVSSEWATTDWREGIVDVMMSPVMEKFE